MGVSEHIYSDSHCVAGRQHGVHLVCRGPCVAVHLAQVPAAAGRALLEPVGRRGGQQHAQTGRGASQMSVQRQQHGHHNSSRSSDDNRGEERRRAGRLSRLRARQRRLMGWRIAAVDRERWTTEDIGDDHQLGDQSRG